MHVWFSLSCVGNKVYYYNLTIYKRQNIIQQSNKIYPLPVLHAVWLFANVSHEHVLFNV